MKAYEVMKKYIKECDEIDNTIYELDYPEAIAEFEKLGWKLDKKFPIGETVADMACGTDEYLARFVKDGVVKWRKFKRAVG